MMVTINGPPDELRATIAHQVGARGVTESIVNVATVDGRNGPKEITCERMGLQLEPEHIATCRLV